MALLTGALIFFLLRGAAGRRLNRSMANDDIAFWMISQRILPPVAVVIPIYVMYQRLGLLDTRRRPDHRVHDHQPADCGVVDA